jgi:ketosteroid isomerase-like protein
MGARSALFAEHAVRAQQHFLAWRNPAPERHVLQGKAAFRESIDEWLSVWESVAVETDHVEVYGDRVVARGAWRSTGRMSGVEGRMPIHIVFTVRDGKIARVDWCQDHEQAVATARDA